MGAKLTSTRLVVFACFIFAMYHYTGINKVTGPFLSNPWGIATLLYCVGAGILVFADLKFRGDWYIVDFRHVLLLTGVALVARRVLMAIPPLLPRAETPFGPRPQPPASRSLQSMSRTGRKILRKLVAKPRRLPFQCGLPTTIRHPIKPAVQ